MAKTAETKSLYMMTLGCPKNRVDSEVMLGTLTQRGYQLVQEPNAADVIVVNTCAFIGPAKEESVDAILEMSEFKKSGQCGTLVVTGCLSQRYAGELAKEMPEVDHFLGTSAYFQIGDLLAAHEVDPGLAVVPGGAEGQGLRAHGAGEELLGQRRSLVGGVGLLADQRDRVRVAEVPQRHGDLEAGLAGAHDEGAAHSDVPAPRVCVIARPSRSA